MCTSNYKEAKETDLANGHFDAGSSSYALLVLVLPCDPERKWQNDALDLVTAVASQVIVEKPTEQPEELGSLVVKSSICKVAVRMWVSDNSDRYHIFNTSYLRIDSFLLLIC